MENQSKPKKVSIIKIIYVLLVIIAIGIIGFFLYRSYSNNKYDSIIDEAIEYINVGDYNSAITASDEAIKLRDKDQKGYELKVQAAQLLNNIDLVKQTYQNLYIKTNNSNYLNEALYASYGNYTGNTLNSSNILEVGEETFLISYTSTKDQSQPYNKYSLWSLSDDSNEIVLTDEGVNAFISDLQVWGNTLFFSTSHGYKKLNINTKEVTDFSIEGVTLPGSNYTDYKSATQLTIYNNEIYFIEHTIANSRFVSEGINKCDLNGNNVVEVVPTQETTSIGYTSIMSFIPVGNDIYYTTNNNFHYQLRRYSNGVQSTIFASDYINPIICSNDSYIYFISVDEAGAYRIYLYNLADGTVSFLNNIVEFDYSSGINCDSESLYYVVQNSLYKTDLVGTELEEIGTINEVNTVVISNAYPKNIYLTITDLYLKYIEDSTELTSIYYYCPVDDFEEFSEYILES